MRERIRVIGGPWPERIGCTGWTVPTGPDHYPWATLPPGDVIILLDDDPLRIDVPAWADGTDGEWQRTWTCVMDARNVVSLGTPMKPTKP